MMFVVANNEYTMEMEQKPKITSKFINVGLKCCSMM